VLSIKQIGLYIAGIAIFYALWIIYAKISHRDVQPDENGKIILRLGLVSIAMGMVSVIAAFSFSAMTLAAIFKPIDDRVFFLILGPPLSALMIFGTIIIFWVKLRVSPKCVEYRGLKGWEIFSWNEIDGVDAHHGLGPRINVKSKRRLYFWPYGYGLNEIATMFLERGKPFDIS
jgi:heme/copper-type cytochrome/quinol oxidase subunit 2